MNGSARSVQSPFAFVEVSLEPFRPLWPGPRTTLMRCPRVLTEMFLICSTGHSRVLNGRAEFDQNFVKFLRKLRDLYPADPERNKRICGTQYTGIMLRSVIRKYGHEFLIRSIDMGTTETIIFPELYAVPKKLMWQWGLSLILRPRYVVIIRNNPMMFLLSGRNVGKGFHTGSTEAPVERANVNTHHRGHKIN